MSTSATNPADASMTEAEQTNASVDKGKGKVVQQEDDAMDEDEEEEEEDEEEEGDEEEDEEEAEDNFEEIDPSAILSSGRRTRGVRIDYSSAEALAKAGLKPEDEHDDADNSFATDK